MSKDFDYVSGCEIACPEYSMLSLAPEVSNCGLPGIIAASPRVYPINKTRSVYGKVACDSSRVLFQCVVENNSVWL